MATPTSGHAPNAHLRSPAHSRAPPPNSHTQGPAHLRPRPELAPSCTPFTSKSGAQVSPSGPPTPAPPPPAPRPAHPGRGRPPFGLPKPPPLAHPVPRAGCRPGAAPPPGLPLGDPAAPEAGVPGSRGGRARWVPGSRYLPGAAPATSTSAAARSSSGGGPRPGPPPLARPMARPRALSTVCPARCASARGRRASRPDCGVSARDGQREEPHAAAVPVPAVPAVPAAPPASRATAPRSAPPPPRPPLPPRARRSDAGRSGRLRAGQTDPGSALRPTDAEWRAARRTAPRVAAAHRCAGGRPAGGVAAPPLCGALAGPHPRGAHPPRGEHGGGGQAPADSGRGSEGPQGREPEPRGGHEPSPGCGAPLGVCANRVLGREGSGVSGSPRGPGQGRSGGGPALIGSALIRRSRSPDSLSQAPGSATRGRGDLPGAVAASPPLATWGGSRLFLPPGKHRPTGRVTGAQVLGGPRGLDRSLGTRGRRARHQSAQDGSSRSPAGRGRGHLAPWFIHQIKANLPMCY